MIRLEADPDLVRFSFEGDPLLFKDCGKPGLPALIALGTFSVIFDAVDGIYY